jgi:hypothetical protein
MDPYLEEPGLWPDVHHGLISEMQAALNQKLRPKYHVRVEERVYISDENDPGRQLIVPDLSIAERERGGPRVAHGTTAAAGATVAEPVELTTLIEDEIREARLEIIDREHRLVVTVIEVLSPANKVLGSRGRESYLQKRAEVMNSPSHLVEIDLLREGARMAAREVVPPADYYVHVSQKDRRPKGRVWPILLPQRLPAIPIPLHAEDGDVPLDLQQVLASVYNRAAYDLEVDYQKQPVPPLPDHYREWAVGLLRARQPADAGAGPATTA